MAYRIVRNVDSECVMDGKPGTKVLVHAIGATSKSKPSTVPVLAEGIDYRKIGQYMDALMDALQTKCASMVFETHETDRSSFIAKIPKAALPKSKPLSAIIDEAAKTIDCEPFKER